MPTWWPAVVFGWPGPILAAIFSVIGLLRPSVAFLVAAAVVLVPFSFYLLLTPRFWWGAFLPALPLIAARAMARGAKRTGWISVLVLIVFVSGMAGFVLIGHAFASPSSGSGTDAARLRRFGDGRRGAPTRDVRSSSPAGPCTTGR